MEEGGTMKDDPLFLALPYISFAPIFVLGLKTALINFSCLHPEPSIRSPDVLVKLQLHTHVQAAFGDTLRQILQID